MKRFGCILLLCAVFVSIAWSQNDLQPLATVKIQRSESITLRLLKNRVAQYQKQPGAPASFTLEQKKEILEAMIDEKLVVQAAQKAGMVITDSKVNEYFLTTVSQQIGRQVTEQEFATIIKQNTGKSLDDYIRDETGFTNVGEFKNYLKNQLIAQQYLASQKQSELQQVTVTDKEIRDLYAVNQTDLVQSETLALFLVIIPKGSNPQDARKQITDVYAEIKNQNANLDAIKRRYASSTTLKAGDIYVGRNPQAMQQLQVSAEQLSELFNRNIGFVSEILETPTDFQFYVVKEKTPAKLLAISDVVQPGSTTTLYELLREQLTQRKQEQYMNEALKDMVAKLRTPDNFKMEKTGAALDALLNNW